MHCNTLFALQSMPPVLCVDLGSLGFLSPFDFDEFKVEIERVVIEKSLSITMRMRLDCSISSADGSQVGRFNALNELLIDRGPNPFLSNIDLFCARQYLTTVQGDGIIIASDADGLHSLLTGGWWEYAPPLPAILVTAICPYTLSFRPFVLPDSAVLFCVLPCGARENGWISFNGKYRQELHEGDCVDIKMCSFPVPTVNKQSFTADWFNSLSTSFSFDVRMRQKQLHGAPAPLQEDPRHPRSSPREGG